MKKLIISTILLVLIAGCTAFQTNSSMITGGFVAVDAISCPNQTSYLQWNECQEGTQERIVIIKDCNNNILREYEESRDC